MSDSLLTEEEVKTFLGVDQVEVEKLKKRGKLTAYRIGGSFVRFRKEQVVAIRTGKRFQMPDQIDRNVFDLVRDFLRFNSIYVLLFVAITLLIFYFLKS